MRHILVVIGIGLTLAGCSVGMALHGHTDPNIGALHIGQSREEVLLNLGQPAGTIATDSGRTDTFALERGNEPSAGRALGHGVMDVLTLGGWELLGTPIEAVQGDTFSLVVEYDQLDRVVHIGSGPTKAGF